MRLYLDEMYPAPIAEMARRAGIDMISPHKCGRDGPDDDEVLSFAARDNRCVVTDNHDDFIRLTIAFYHEQRHHAGVILVPSPVGHNQYARLAAALVRLARDNPNGLQPYEIRWLSMEDT